MTVLLEDNGIQWSTGYDAWNRDGRFAFHAVSKKTVFQRHATWFRDCRTGKTYRIVSRLTTKLVEARFLPLESQVPF